MYKVTSKLIERSASGEIILHDGKPLKNYEMKFACHNDACQKMSELIADLMSVVYSRNPNKKFTLVGSKMESVSLNGIEENDEYCNYKFFADIHEVDTNQPYYSMLIVLEAPTTNIVVFVPTANGSIKLVSHNNVQYSSNHSINMFVKKHYGAELRWEESDIPFANKQNQSNEPPLSKPPYKWSFCEKKEDYEDWDEDSYEPIDSVDGNTYQYYSIRNKKTDEVRFMIAKYMYDSQYIAQEDFEKILGKKLD